MNKEDHAVFKAFPLRLAPNNGNNFFFSSIRPRLSFFLLFKLQLVKLDIKLDIDRTATDSENAKVAHP